jgi:hypothetical protein
MTIDAYAQCPGATGKKIKFCCPDFAPELDKIGRMLEGEQFTACLKHIESLRETPANSDRECLLAYQVMLLRATGRIEEGQALAEYFLQKHPENQAALSELSMLAVTQENEKAAMQYLQQSVSLAKGVLAWQTIYATESLAEYYFEHGRWIPARALLKFVLSINKQNQHASAMLIDLMNSAQVPLLLKEDPPLGTPAKETPWASRYLKAINPMASGDWIASEKNLADLAAELPDVPEIWRALATIRGWLGDLSGCADALKKYASLDVLLDDSVDAEATAMLLSEYPLGDDMPVLNVSWTVKDVDRLQEALLSDPNVKPIKFDPAMLSDENSPPPKAIWMLFDRPNSETSENLTAQTMPKFIGQLFLYGRQTDHEARLEILGIVASELDQVRAAFKKSVAQWLEDDEKSEEMAKASATLDLLQPQWRPNERINPNKYRELIGDYFSDAILNRWPDMKLGVLGGLSLREAAADPKNKIRLLATIVVMQYYADIGLISLDLNKLRTQLGLPVQEPIVPRPNEITSAPLARLDRICVENLSDIDLAMAFQKAVGYSHKRAVLKFGTEIINRPAFVGRRELSLAYLMLARLEADTDRALEYIEAGRKVSDSLKESHSIYDLEELSLRFARQEINQAIQLVKHIEEKHIKEPEVSKILTQILINVGILRPDGTPAIPTQAETGMAAATPAEAEPGKLWTPDGESSGASGKLWVPD